jgi:hypothetical protein
MEMNYSRLDLFQANPFLPQTMCVLPQDINGKKKLQCIVVGDTKGGVQILEWNPKKNEITVGRNPNLTLKNNR